MAHIKWFLFMLLFFQISFAQNLLEVKGKIPLNVEKYEGTDKYGNLYYFNKNVFYKTGKGVNYQFNDLQLGKPTRSDILNPMKIILFYENTNTVVFLDQHLIEISRINFNQLPEFKTIGFATEASGDNIWIFNINNQQLEIFDYTKKKATATSQPLNSKILDFESNFNFCWILTENYLEKYNVYGSLIEKIPNSGFEQLTEDNGDVIAQKDTNLYLKKKGLSKFEKLQFPQLDIKAFFLNDRNLYIYDGNFLYEYYLK